MSLYNVPATSQILIKTLGCVLNLYELLPLPDSAPEPSNHHLFTYCPRSRDPGDDAFYNRKYHYYHTDGVAQYYEGIRRSFDIFEQICS